MSTYALAQRGVISATSADGAGPKNFTLPSAIKPDSSFVVARIKDRRRNVSAQRGVVAIANPDVSPKDVTITAVDTAATFVRMSHREDRAGNAKGLTVELLNSTTLRFRWPGTVAVGETIDAEWEVVESKPQRNAIVTIFDATTVRLTWDGTLQTGETIDAAFDVFDLEAFGDDQKEVIFRLQRILGYLGENAVQDLLLYDDAGNMTQYRLRVFNSKVNAEAATLDLPDASPLETGELARVTVTQDVELAKNDRVSMIRVLTDLLTPTPGVN